MTNIKFLELWGYKNMKRAFVITEHYKGKLALLSVSSGYDCRWEIRALSSTRSWQLIIKDKYDMQVEAEKKEIITSVKYKYLTLPGEIILSLHKYQFEISGIPCTGYAIMVHKANK